MATAAHARRLGASRDDPSAAPTPGRAQFDLSSGAATAVVFLSIVLCFVLLCTYCRCARQRAIAAARGDRRAMRHGFPSALLRPADGAALPVVRYADAGAKKGQLPEGDCPVCLEAFGDDDGVKVVPACGHVFHAPCIDRWLDVRNSCPVCRCVVVPICYYADRAGPHVDHDHDDGDDQEVVLERVVAMIEAIREEEAAARRAPATSRAGG